MWKSVASYLRHSVSRRPRGWHPLLAVYYLTYGCDFRCPYCSDGAGKPYHQLRSRVLRGAQLGSLLGRLRAACDHLVITGGEPLIHPDFARLLDELPAHEFDSVVLTTNGYDVARHLDGVSRAIRYLVFSLDTLDAARADAWFGKGPGTFDRICASIEQARIHPRRRYEIVISSVATPDNVQDLYAVYDYAAARGFRFAVCPVLRGVSPDPALRDHAEYRRLFDFLIAEKRKGQAINGTVRYLEHMRDLTQFRCRPSTVLAVSPVGDVFYPCLEIGKVAGNLLDAASIHALRAEGLRLHGPEPTCPNQCQSACALGFSLILDHPLTMAHEAYLMLKERWRRGARRRLPAA